MTLSDLEAAGAYVVAGNVDIYHEGKHKRLAALTAGGDLLMTPEGDAFMAALDVATATPESEAPAPAPVPAARSSTNSPGCGSIAANTARRHLRTCPSVMRSFIRS